MNCRIRDAALLLIVLALATGLASAQPGLQVSSKGSNGTVTQTTYTFGASNGPAVKAPSNPSIATGLGYWDGLAEGDYYYGHFRIANPHPQIGVGPDDILTIAGLEIARYPNPITAGGPGGPLPIAYPAGGPYQTNPITGAWPNGSAPTETIYLDTWLGITNLQTLCPSGTGDPNICVIDNATIRYDQMQGRFVVLFTVTDMTAHRSNFVMIVSRYSQFTKCSSTTPPPATCPASSPLFTSPTIAPIVGGPGTGGTNTNWYYYTIPVNLTYVTPPSTLGTATATTAPRVGTVNTLTISGAPSNLFVTVNFCPNGGPGPALAPITLTARPAGTAGNCTNYFPTSARLGFDNDNIIIASVVLDQMGSSAEGTLQTANGTNAGPFVGNRVVTFPKIVAYNGTGTGAVASTQPPACVGAFSCVAVNLADNLVTGTITAIGAYSTSVATTCETSLPSATIAPGVCSPTATGLGAANPIPSIFLEPDNLRGRSLASFDAEVAPAGTPQQAVITPIDYLVGTYVHNGIENNLLAENGNPFNASLDPGRFWIETIAFSCAGISEASAGLPWCLNAGSVVAEVPQLGTLEYVNSITGPLDPAPVGQGWSAALMTTSQNNQPINTTVPNRLFVGDSRPEQVMFREGLLYTARTNRLMDWYHNPLETSTVTYDIIKTCATAAPLPNCPPATTTNDYVVGGNITGVASPPNNPAIEYETEWFNLLSTPDPSGNINGFGFYQPMFDVPADVIQTGPASPSNSAEPLLEKLFVGMTTGGTANLAATFSHNFPSLWDFRPGDDAYDTVEPYTDPVTGDVITTVPCPGTVTVTALSASGTTVTVGSTVGLSLGMFLTTGTNTSTITGIAGNVITLSAALAGVTTFPATLTFSISPPSVTATATVVTTTAGPTTTITLGSVPATLQIGSTISSAKQKVAGTTFGTTTSIIVPSTTNVAVGDTVSAIPSSFTATINAGDLTFSVPNTTPIAVGGLVCAPAAATGLCAASAAGLYAAGGATVTAIVPDTVNINNNKVTVNSAALLTISAGSVVFDPTALITGSPTVTAVGTNGVVTLSAATALVSGPCPGTGGAGQTWPSGPCPSTTSVQGAPGVTVQFTSSGFFSAGTTVVNMSGNTITLSGPVTIPGTTPPTTSTNVLFSFSSVALTCPMIPFSSRGGAATDPNDGSLWLYGEFAKNRLGSVPGPGAWGTSVANYGLSFPVTDAYGNDNSFFTDVQPGNYYFTWIQIAHNIGIAQTVLVPATAGTCPNSGVTPIIPPPASGGTAGTGLFCPAFGPTVAITRSEMARWIVLGQMDEQQISSFLCASGPSPTTGAVQSPPLGSNVADACSSNNTSNSTFADDIGDPNQRYIEVMARRGYTHGCGATNDGTALFCPTANVTRAQMAVFVIRAKMNNVFPSSLSGIQKINQSAIYADNFALFAQAPYFNDCTASSGNSCSAPDNFLNYVQLMRELRISNGTGGCPAGFTLPCYSPEANITRQEVATFIVRAFFL